MFQIIRNLLKMLYDETQVGGATDLPSSNDYCASQILGVDASNLPETIKFKTIPDNQATLDETKVACTCFSSYHVARIINEMELNRALEGMPAVGWQFQKKFGTYTEKGDTLQTAIKSVIKNGFHEKNKIYGVLGYAKIKHEELKSWLAQGYPIITCANVTKTNFKKAKIDGVWGGNDGERTTGHAFALIGYEDDYFWALNSYGPDWGKFEDGTFKIKATDIDYLGSMYLLYDEKDIRYIFRDVTNLSPFAKSIEWALEEGIMKGYESETLPAEKRFFKPESPVTRAEFAEILYRFKQKYL